jgi:endopolyphosphatase
MKWILPAYALAGLRSATAAPDVQKTLGNVATSSGRESKHGRKLKGRFLQVTDIHPDPFYKTYSSTSAGSFCHRGSSLAAGYYGAESSDCDSPLALVNATFAWINEHLAHEVDFVIWTGDSARHDNDEEIPRTEEQVLGTNRMLVEKFREVFGNKERDHGRGGSAWRVPVIPTFGNNDILPHNIMVRGPNRWTRHYQDVWGDIVPEAQKHAFDRGGWYFVEVIPNKLAVFSLNTM